MSDQKSSFGEPVDEPKNVDNDVVGRAHEGLAEAEAAKRDAADQTRADERRADEHRADERRADEPVVTASEPTSDELTPAERDAAAQRDAVDNSELAASRSAEPAAASDSTPWYEKQDEDEARWAAYAASADVPETTRHDADATPTVVAEPVAAPAPAETNPAVFPAAGQPIFVQAPEAPVPRGNRGAAGAIGLLAALVFAVLYLGATLAIDYFFGDLRPDGLVDAILAGATSWALWVPVVVFFIAFWLLGAIINRGRWGHWVVWGLLVGVAAWGGHILGQLFVAPFWTLNAREGAELVASELLAPLSIVAFVLGRELTIWFGAWVAKRGQRMNELNVEALREYERTLEAGPKLHQG